MRGAGQMLLYAVGRVHGRRVSNGRRAAGQRLARIAAQRTQRPHGCRCPLDRQDSAQGAVGRCSALQLAPTWTMPRQHLLCAELRHSHTTSARPI
ncbi:MAG TPA: hypothetical protein VFS21_30930 [Roseiflexaceae bacterium]|nr:hypothetical protein [Roseiflexaceae bacterium]